MDFLLKALATAVVVALVMTAARRHGDRTAGLLAGLPIVTLPALAWIAGSGGAELASRTAVGSVAGCLLAPVFAIAYGRAARRWRPAGCLAAALAAVGGALALACRLPAPAAPGPALGLSFAAGLVALRCLPAGPPTVAGRRAPATLSIGASAGLVGLVSALVASLATAAGPHLAGLAAGLPTIGLAAVVEQHRDRGAASVSPFLRAYVVSSLGKALFGALFPLAAGSCGAWMALPLALAACLGFCLVANAVDASDHPRRTRTPRPRGPSVARPPPWPPMRWLSRAVDLAAFRLPARGLEP